MSEQQSGKNRWFSVFYRTRVRVWKGNTPIINLSLIFSILAVGTAPWLAAAGIIAAIAMGYRFGIERNAAEFSGDFDEVVRDAAQNVKNVVNSVTEKEV